MQFETPHDFLAKAAQGFGLKGLDSPQLRKKIRQVLDKTDKWERKKCPLTAPLVVWFVLGLMLFRHLSISNVRRRFLDLMRGRRSGISLHAITPEAFMHARSRLGAAMMKELFELQARDLVLQPSFHGLHVFGVDGVRFKVFDNRANEEKFGRLGGKRGKGAFPQMLAVVLTDNWGRQIRAAVPCHSKTSERAACPELLKHLGAGDVCLMDRGFPSVWLVYAALQKGTHLVVRLPKTWKPILLKENGPGDSLVGVVGPMNTVKGGPEVCLKLRLIQYQVNGSRLSLLTTLLDPQTYPASELAQLYHVRWECELCYKEVKHYLATVTTGVVQLVFRSKTPAGVYQEFWALMLLYNLIRGLIVEAVTRAPGATGQTAQAHTQTDDIRMICPVPQEAALPDHTPVSAEPRSQNCATVPPRLDGVHAESRMSGNSNVPDEPPNQPSPNGAVILGKLTQTSCGSDDARYDRSMATVSPEAVATPDSTPTLATAPSFLGRVIHATPIHPAPKQAAPDLQLDLQRKQAQYPTRANDKGGETPTSPIAISFTEALEVLRLALPRLQDVRPSQIPVLYDQMLKDIADCSLRPRRPRQYPRVVKIKMSNFLLKRSSHHETKLDNVVHLVST